jgi:hypothetical protein
MIKQLVRRWFWRDHQLWSKVIVRKDDTPLTRPKDLGDWFGFLKENSHSLVASLSRGAP